MGHVQSSSNASTGGWVASELGGNCTFACFASGNGPCDPYVQFAHGRGAATVEGFNAILHAIHANSPNFSSSNCTWHNDEYGTDTKAPNFAHTPGGNIWCALGDRAKALDKFDCDANAMPDAQRLCYCPAAAPSPPPPSPPLPPSAYNVLASRGCVDRNELGTHYGSSKSLCREACDLDPACVSFEISTNNVCQMSSTCTSAILDNSYSEWTFFEKINIPYDFVVERACIGRNELGITSGSSLSACQAACDANAACVSFEISTSFEVHCQLSTSCTRARLDHGTVANWYHYEKQPQT
jgi:hypothetical protein